MSCLAAAERRINILHLLTEEIYEEARALSLEQRGPARDPDASDTFMKEKKDSIKELRKLRERVEEIFSGVLL